MLQGILEEADRERGTAPETTAEGDRSDHTDHTDQSDRSDGDEPSDTQGDAGPTR